MLEKSDLNNKSRFSFSLPEIEIFNIVKEWHEHHNVKDPKEILIKNIRLPLMKMEELLNYVRNSNLISSNVILYASNRNMSPDIWNLSTEVYFILTKT
jgi:hypothetical protein